MMSFEKVRRLLLACGLTLPCATTCGDNGDHGELSAPNHSERGAISLGRSRQAISARPRNVERVRMLLNATQSSYWPPSDVVDEHGDYVLIGKLLDRVGGVVSSRATSGVIVSRHTIPPLGSDGMEDFSNPKGAPYRVLRELDLRPGSADFDMVMYANSYGPPKGSFGGTGRIPSDADGPYNLNSFGIVCSDHFPTRSQRDVFRRSRVPLHLVPISSFRGDGVQYDADTGVPFIPRLRSGSECYPDGCLGEDATSHRDASPITLGSWLSARGEVAIQLRDYDEERHAYTRARFVFDLSGLLPNSVYTFWAIRASGEHGQLPDPIALPNMRRSDEYGRLQAALVEENPFPDPRSADGGQRIIAVSVHFHPDFQNWGACLSKLGPGVDTVTVFNTAADGSNELTDFTTLAPTTEQLRRARYQEAEVARRDVAPFPPEEDPFFSSRPGDGPSRVFGLAGVSQGPLYPPSVTLDESGNFLTTGFILGELSPGIIAPIAGAALIDRDTVPPLDANGKEDYTNLLGAAVKVLRPLDLSRGSPDLDIPVWNASHGPVAGDFGGGVRLQKPGDSLYNLNQAQPGDDDACPEQFPSVAQREGHWIRERHPLTQVPIYGLQGDQLGIDPDTGSIVAREEARVDTRPRFEPITYGDFLASHGEKHLKITLTRFSPELGAYTAARFELRFRHHVPNTVYHVSLLRSQIANPRPLRGNPTSLTVANAFTTDERGDAYFSAELPHPFPDPSVDDSGLRVIGIVGAHHFDYMNKAGCPGIFGSGVDSGANFNTLVQFGFPSEEGAYGMVDFVTRPAPSTSAGPP
jgi:hypothetical protein